MACSPSSPPPLSSSSSSSSLRGTFCALFSRRRWFDLCHRALPLGLFFLPTSSHFTYQSTHISYRSFSPLSLLYYLPMIYQLVFQSDFFCQKNHLRCSLPVLSRLILAGFLSKLALLPEPRALSLNLILHSSTDPVRRGKDARLLEF